MARALRPAVLLILLASVLFLVDGILDGVYPGGSHGSIDAYLGLGWTSYLFALVNAVVAVFIARGSERMLALRIGLAAFFIFERSVSAVALGVKPIESMAVHGVTALVEAVILASTMRVWRLGHSVAEADLSLLTLPTSAMPATARPAAGGGAASRAVAVESPPVSRRRGLRFPGLGRGGKPAAPAAIPAADAAVAAPAAKAKEPMAVRVRTLSRRMTWALGLLSLLLAVALLADGAAAGIVPGVTVDLASPAWLVYVFALVLLVIASRAVHGGRFAMRLLLVVALIYFVERAFTPFVLRLVDPVSLALHLFAALVALVLALATAAALRASRLPRATPAS